MPIELPEGLPARDVLAAEGIPLLPPGGGRLSVALLNLMPEKIKTENQIARVLGASPYEVKLTLLRTATHESRNTAAAHLEQHYRTFEQVRDQRFDGLIITGAPVETLPFEQVDYWPELEAVMDWAKRHARSTLGLCWGAQSMLWRYHKVEKFTLPAKMFGVFRHRVVAGDPVIEGFPDELDIPVSRHTENHGADIARLPALKLLLDAEESGLCLIAEPANRRYYMFNHLEYDATTLKDEYQRDRGRGDVAMPKHYFPRDDATRPPPNRWRAHGRLFYGNWLGEIAKRR